MVLARVLSDMHSLSVSQNLTSEHAVTQIKEKCWWFFDKIFAIYILLSWLLNVFVKQRKAVSMLMLLVTSTYSVPIANASLLQSRWPQYAHLPAHRLVHVNSFFPIVHFSLLVNAKIHSNFSDVSKMKIETVNVPNGWDMHHRLYYTVKRRPLKRRILIFSWVQSSYLPIGLFILTASIQLFILAYELTQRYILAFPIYQKWR